MPGHHARVAAALLACTLAPAFALVGVGCSHAEIIETGSVPTPPISLSVAGERNLLEMLAPHPGWGLEIDRAQKTPGPTRLLVTERRPEPALLFPQQIVDKRVTTTVDADQPVEIFGRVLDHNASGDDTPYRRVIIGDDGA